MRRHVSMVRSTIRVFKNSSKFISNLAAGTGDTTVTPTSHIEYLLLQKKEEHRRHNWGPPKGYSKAGESDISTSLRETAEETGLKEKDLSVLTEFPMELNYIAWRRKKHVRYWPARLIDPAKGTIILSEEHEAYRWVPINDAVELAFGQDMKEQLQKCDAFLRNLYGTS